MSVVCIQYSNSAIRFVSDSRGTREDGTYRDDQKKLFGAQNMIFSATGATYGCYLQPTGAVMNAIQGEKELLLWSKYACEKAGVEALTKFVAEHGSIHTGWLAGIDQQGKRWLRGINTSIENGTLKHTPYGAESLPISDEPRLVCSGGQRVNLAEYSDARKFVEAAIAIGISVGGPVQEMTI